MREESPIKDPDTITEERFRAGGDAELSEEWKNVLLATGLLEGQDEELVGDVPGPRRGCGCDAFSQGPSGPSVQKMPVEKPRDMQKLDTAQTTDEFLTLSEKMEATGSPATEGSYFGCCDKRGGHSSGSDILEASEA